MDTKINSCSFEKWDDTKSFSNYYASQSLYVEYNGKYYRAKSFNTEAYYGTGIIPSESPEFWEEVYMPKNLKINNMDPKTESRGGNKDTIKECSGCRGLGIKITVSQVGPLIKQTSSICNECNSLKNTNAVNQLFGK